MRVLGIDPGLAHVGWCVRVDNTVVAAGVFRTKATPGAEREAEGITKASDLMRRAQEIAAWLDSSIETFKPELVSWEAMSLGFVQPITMMQMGVAFGTLAAVARVHRVPCSEVPPKWIKAWTRGALRLPLLDGRKLAPVEKEHVIQAVRAAWPNIEWPRATADHEHLADAAVCAQIAMENQHPEHRREP